MDRYEEQLERDGLRRATLILTQEEFDEADLSNEELREAGYGPCPTTATYNSLTSNGKFSKMRKQWKEELSNDNYGSLCRCFEASIAPCKDASILNQSF
ncbi:hypothetical protein FRC08_012054 [Ceratobasidium sp. 394]|nr:hypothetical protein FRC08_012054 [Ceratobasidium sp. 394]